MTEMVEELLKPQEEEWLCNSNEAVTIWFCKLIMLYQKKTKKNKQKKYYHLI